MADEILTPKKAHAEAKRQGKELTAFLRRFGEEKFANLPDGTPVTRMEALAREIWKRAVGETTEIEDPTTGKIKVVTVPAEKWAMEFVVERLEGKAATTTQENQSGIKALDKVRALSADRANDISKRVRNKLPDPTPVRDDEE